MSSPNLEAEGIFAGRLMTLMAGRVTDGLATFSGWLIGGFVAVFAFLLGHLDTVTKFIPAASLGLSGKVFLAALALHVAQRYLAFIVTGAVAAAKDAESMPTAEGLDFGVVFEHLERSTFWPARILVKRSFAKVRSGDFAASGRLLAVLTQTQGLLVIGQLLVVVIATYVVVAAL